LLLRAIADGLEWSYGWSEPAAQRLRLPLDFGCATGLRASELVGVELGSIRVDGHSDHWLHLVGKGTKPGKVALPPHARTALDQYLAQRRLPVTRQRWNPNTRWSRVSERTGMRGSQVHVWGASCAASLHRQPT
jgi:integrase